MVALIAAYGSAYCIVLLSLASCDSTGAPPGEYPDGAGSENAPYTSMEGLGLFGGE